MPPPPISASPPAPAPAPYLAAAATDARHFARLTDRVYRFTPVRATPDLVATIHGTDERISVDDYRRVVDFYARLIRGD